MTFFILWCLAGLAVGIVFASFFEWTLHKYVMHRPVGNFRYAFQAHAIVHHGTFKADKTYHLIDEKDKETIPMAWWNGPVLVLIGAVPFAILSWLTGQWAFVARRCPRLHLLLSVFTNTSTGACTCQRPAGWKNRGGSGGLNGHHLLHHRYMHKNFNVVLPIADLCLGTFMARAKTHFAQATGPSVPDIQPLA